MQYNQLPVNPVTGETPLDLALRLQRGINVNRIKGEAAYGIEMVFTAEELRILWMAMAHHLQVKHGIHPAAVNDAYDKRFGNDDDILRTEGMMKAWKNSESTH